MRVSAALRSVLAAPESTDELGHREHANAVDVAWMPCKANADVTFELFLLAQGVKCAEVSERDVLLCLNLDGGVVVHDEVHLEAGRRAPIGERFARHVVSIRDELVKQVGFERGPPFWCM